MSIENVSHFFQTAHTDVALQQKLSAIDTSSRDAATKAIAALSADTSHPFTAEELLAAVPSIKALSEADLAEVSGGQRDGRRTAEGTEWFNNIGRLISPYYRLTS